MKLIDLLRHCGVHSYRQGARHVHFSGVEKELPQSSDGSYGTSIIYGNAMNAANDILIAYKHNGKLLAPDHGYPVRMIIPGGIGGRMVKWLAKIEVSDKDSDNFYHHHDNKVMPAGIDMDRANNESESALHCSIQQPLCQHTIKCKTLVAAGTLSVCNDPVPALLTHASK